MERSPPAASKPFGSASADWTGGKGVSCSSQGIIPLSALHLLPAVLRQLAHYAPALDDRMGMPTVIEGEAEFVLAEKFVEQLTAQRTDRGQTVALRIVFEKNRRERLRCRACQYLRALGGIVLAVLGAAVDHMGELASGGLFVAVADEADLAGGIGESMGADRRIGDDAVFRAHAARPLIGLLVRGLQLSERLGGPAEVQQEAGCRGKRVVENEIPARLERATPERPARRVDEPRAGIEPRARVGRRRWHRCAERRRGAGQHEISSLHGKVCCNAKGCRLPVSSELLRRQDFSGVKTERPRLAVGIEVTQRRRDRAEGDFLPGNLALLEQPDLQGFLARGEVAVEQPGAVEDVDLVHVGHRQKRDRKSTRLNSSHSQISYAVFCLKKKNREIRE